MRILFAGTPQVAVPSLEALARRFDVVAVLTRPDAVRGRGRVPTSSPVKLAAANFDIPVLEMSPRDPQFLSVLADLRVDAAAVVAYGRILPQTVLDALPLGWYNLHFSLLPLWRGAAPVQRALWNGDQMTGISVFKVTAGMDEGPVLLQSSLPVAAAAIDGRPDSGQLLDFLSRKGAHLLSKAFKQIETGSAEPVEQPVLDESDADRAYAAKITVDDAHIDVSLPASVLDCRIRACNPDPGAWARLSLGGLEDTGRADKAEGTLVHLNQVTPVPLSDEALQGAIERQYGLETLDLDGERTTVPRGVAAGSLVVSKRRVWLMCGEGALELNDITVQGKKPMSGAEWARGARLGPEARLG